MARGGQLARRRRGHKQRFEAHGPGHSFLCWGRRVCLVTTVGRGEGGGEGGETELRQLRAGSGGT